MKLYAYKQGSASAKALAEALGIKRIKHDGVARYFDKDVVINWGSSQIRRIKGCKKMFNHPDAIAKASNKLKAFNAMAEGVSIPEFTTSHEQAFKWLQEGKSVVARHTLTGHSGAGIEIFDTAEDFYKDGWKEAPLYTQYIKKTQEYRLHVFGGKVFFIQRKARKKDVPDDQVNWQVRNHGNGFIFAHQDVDVPDVAKEEAVKAIMALGLDFGAVDLIMKKDGTFYVLEVNTACGLEGETLKKYVEQFNNYR